VTGRTEVLRRIRLALSNSAGSEPGPGENRGSTAGAARADSYRLHGDVTGAALLDLLASRLTDYRALVRRATAATLADEISAALAGRGVRTVVVPPGLNVPLPTFAAVTVDDGQSAADLDAFDVVVTAAAVAIAETGTIVLDGAPDQGRRAISLVPDYHLCIVTSGQVVHLVPEAIQRLADSAGRPLTWISGPSATSDIELERVEGVHGPRTLEVILVT